MNYRVKTNFDRGYVNAMDKVRVFIESNQKVMFVNTDEYKDAKNARAAYVNAITLIRAGEIVGSFIFSSRRRPFYQLHY